MTNQVEEITTKLVNANQAKQPIPFLRYQYTLDEETAYTVQDEFMKRRCELGNAAVAGYKISMTSDETQAIADTDEPAYGTLLTTDIVESGSSVSLSSLFSPLIETEIMFHLTEDLTPGADEEEIVGKSKISAGIEVPDSRYVDWFPNFSLTDLLSDNAATGFVVVSNPITPPSIKELANVKMELFHDGEKISEGLSSEVLDNPASAVAWLSRKLASQNKTLKKGMVISSGTFIPPLAVKEGTYTVAFTGIGQAGVTFVSS